MGTRNLTVVKNADGEVLVAQYGQWDGYPSYTGAGIIGFLSDSQNVDNLKAGIEFTHFITDEKVDSIYNEVTARAGEEAFKESYPSLTRDTGWEIIKIVSEKTNVPLVNSIDFAADELFCEGYYEIDFSTNKFITKYNGMTIEHSLYALPMVEDYVKSFEKSLTNA
jgi:hypothetical protein